MSARRTRSRSHGGATFEQALLVLAVAAVGILSMRALGGAEASAIGDDSGGGTAVPVATFSAQAGTGGPQGLPPDGRPAAGNDPGAVTPEGAPPDAENGVGTGDDWSLDPDDARWEPGEFPPPDPHAWRGDCGLNPFCHVASLTSRFVGDNLSRASNWVSDKIGDIPILGPIVRGVGGLIDGLWDGVFDIARGLKELAESLVWDFLVEDVALGSVRGLAGLGCKLVTLGQACEDSSWNPVKSITDSLWDFGKGVWNAHHMFGAVLHEASICANPFNGQAAEDRGHACGATVLTIVDAIFFGKGAAKAAKAVKARRAAKAVEGLLDDAARCAGGICRVGSGACFVEGTPVTTGSRRVRIEELSLGMRVSTLAPGVDNATRVNPASWRLYQFEMADPAIPGALIEVETLQPIGTYDDALVGSTATVRLSFEEWGISGDAHLVAVGATPPLEDGDGFVVVSTFRRESDDVYDIRFEGSADTLSPTGTHRFWSVDREDWVAARTLREGERLRTAHGEVTIAHVARRDGRHTVYNVEVEHAHTYLVGALDVLTHNQCAVGAEVLARAADGVLTFAKVAEVLPDGRVVLEIRTPAGLVRRVVRYEELFQFPKEWAIGGRGGLRELIEKLEDRHLVRDPHGLNKLDDGYRRSHAWASGEFYDWFVAGRPITADSLSEIIRRMHRETAPHYKGDGKMPNVPGEFLPGPGMTPGRPAGASPWGRNLNGVPVDVAGTLRRAGVSPEEIARLQLDGPVRVRGIPDEHLPRNEGSRHHYAHMDQYDVYLRAAAARLETIRTMAPNKSAFVSELADFFHTMANARVFGQVNNATWMDQVNALLRTMGHPGIPHGNLDFVALAVDYETFRKVFRQAVRDAAN